MESGLHTSPIEKKLCQYQKGEARSNTMHGFGLTKGKKPPSQPRECQVCFKSAYYGIIHKVSRRVQIEDIFRQ